MQIVQVVPREAVRHQLAQEAGGQGEGGQQGGGVGRGGEETLPIGFNLDSAEEEEHQPAGGPNKMQVSAPLQERGDRRVQVAVH